MSPFEQGYQAYHDNIWYNPYDGTDWSREWNAGWATAWKDAFKDEIKGFQASCPHKNLIKYSKYNQTDEMSGSHCMDCGLNN